jgi:hypothetical protein
MSHAKAALVTLFVALTASAVAPVGAAGDNVLTLTVPAVVVDPCTGEVGTGTLHVLLVVNQDIAPSGEVHVDVHASVHGELTGNQGSLYQVSAEGNSQSSVMANHYDVPFHGNAAGEGSAPNLKVDGIGRVHVDATGDPLGAGIVSLSASCGG